MAQESEENSQRRQHFRVTFAENKGPRLLIAGIFYSVIDISESGLRFRNPLHYKLPRDTFPAQLEFPENETIKITGSIVRADYDQVAMRLAVGIPYKIILREQVEFVKRKTKG